MAARVQQRELEAQQVTLKAEEPLQAQMASYL